MDQKSLSCKIKDQEKEGGAGVIKGQLMAAPKKKEKACGGKEGREQADCDGKPPGKTCPRNFFTASLVPQPSNINAGDMETSLNDTL